MSRPLPLAAAMLLLPAFATAQQPQQPAPPRTVVVSSWKCNWDSLGRISRITDSLLVPIARELINEGHWASFGLLLHDWADEWNVVYYYAAPDRQRFFAGWAEFIRRFQQRHPTAPPLTRMCSEHKDNIYSWGPRVDAAAPSPPRE